MSRSVGVVLLVVALLAGLVGGFWAFMKAAGAEVDYCDGPNCTSGWYGAAAFLALALIVGGVGLGLLRSGGQGPRPR